MVQGEPGLSDPKVIKEARSAQLTTLLSGEKNSFLNAKMAYSKMTGEKLPDAKVNDKLKAHIVLTEGDNFKIVGAMTVVKELLESTKIDKSNALELYNKIKGIINSF